MPFYNCWCNEYIANYYVTELGVVQGDNSPYKVAMVPIKFNKKYTIAADSSSAVMIAPIYQENNQLIPAWSGFSISSIFFNSMLKSSMFLSKLTFLTFVLLHPDSNEAFSINLALLYFR